MNAPRRRWPMLLVALLLLGGGGVAAWRVSAKPAAPTSPWVLGEVKRGDVVVQVTASGTVKPVNQVDVGAQVSGRIKNLFVDFNDTVKQGQLIAVIDPSLFESAKAQADARLESSKADQQKAEAQLASAEVELQRTTGLRDKGLASDAEVLTADITRRQAVAAVSSAKAAVTLAKAAQEQAVQNLGYCRITAPVNGIVISRNVEVGQTVAASLQAPTLFVIAEDLRQMEVHTNVAESDVGQLAEGQRVDFSVDAWPNRTFEGRVRQVRYAAQTVSNVVTYDAVVRVDNEALALRPGMTANATFIIAEQRGVVTVPSAALRYKPKWSADGGVRGPHGRDGGWEFGRPPEGPMFAGPPGGGPRGDGPPGALRDGAGPDGGGRGGRGLVFVLRDGQPKPVRVVTGLTDGAVTEVVQGELEPGDQVIVSDAAPAKSGAGPAQRPTNRQQGGPPRPPGIF